MQYIACRLQRLPSAELNRFIGSKSINWQLDNDDDNDDDSVDDDDVDDDDDGRGGGDDDDL
jgi:hypothetical protein